MIFPYADDSALYSTALKLENTAETLLQWVKDSRMKANPDKYHLLIITKKVSK